MDSSKRLIQLSPSQVRSFSRCSWAWFLRYRAGIILKPNSFLTVGSAVHEGIRADYETMLESGELAPLDVIQDIAAEAFELMAPETVFENEDPGDAKDDAVALAKLHHQRVAPTVEPKEVEAWLDVAIDQGDGPAILLHQRPDLITQDGRIVDNKTGTRRINPEEIHLDHQLTSYALGYKTKFGEDPKEVALHRLIRYQTSLPKEQIVTDERTQFDYDRYIQRLLRIATRIDKNDVYPVDEPSICRYCGFAPICLGFEWWKDKADLERPRKRAQQLIADKLAVGTVLPIDETESGGDNATS